jgi:uncharacterized protein (UPF0179 family)
MQITSIKTMLATTAVFFSLAAPSIAMAYDEDDAIKDCEKRLRDEYQLTDFRHQKAEKLAEEGHKYKVTGNTKVDGDKYDFSCDIKDRHVTSVTYDGPEKEGMSDAQKAAVGVAAVAASAAIAAKLKEKEEEKERFANVSSTGLKACRDAVGKRPEYRSVSTTDIFVTAKVHDDANVEWRIETEKLNDWGTCHVSEEDEVVAVRTKQHEMKY